MGLPSQTNEKVGLWWLMGNIDGYGSGGSSRLDVWWVCVGCSWILGVVCIHMDLVAVGLWL